MQVAPTDACRRTSPARIGHIGRRMPVALGEASPGGVPGTGKRASALVKCQRFSFVGDARHLVGTASNKKAPGPKAGGG